MHVKSIFLPATILAATILAATVAAYPAKTTGGISLVRRGLHINYDDRKEFVCSDAQTETLKKELGRALQMVNLALKLQRDDPVYKYYMDQSSNPHRYLRVRKHFQRMKDLLVPSSDERKATTTVAVSCGGPTDQRCNQQMVDAMLQKYPAGMENHNKEGIVDKSGEHKDMIKYQEMKFCPLWFEMAREDDKAAGYIWPTSYREEAGVAPKEMCTIEGMKNFDTWKSSPARTIIHELSHIHFGDNAWRNFGDQTDVEVVPTLDCVYSAYWSHRAAQAAPAMAETNADNYANLAMAAFIKNSCENLKRPQEFKKVDLGFPIQEMEPSVYDREGKLLDTSHLTRMGFTWAAYQKCRSFVTEDSIFAKELPVREEAFYDNKPLEQETEALEEGPDTV